MSGEWLDHPMEWFKRQVKAHPELTVAERYSLAAIADGVDPREGYCYRTNEQLADRFGIRFGTFRKHVAKFQRIGLIYREQSRRRDGGFGRARIYLADVNPPHRGSPESAAVNIADRGSPESAAVTPTAAPLGEPDRGSPERATGVPLGVPPTVGPSLRSGSNDAVASDEHLPATGNDHSDVADHIDNGNGMHPCGCGGRVGHFSRRGRRWCLECGGFRQVECSVCSRVRSGQWVRETWACRECVPLASGEVGAVPVEVGAAEPGEELDEEPGAREAEPGGGVDFADVPAGTAAGDRGDAFGHSREYCPATGGQESEEEVRRAWEAMAADDDIPF